MTNPLRRTFTTLFLTVMLVAVFHAAAQETDLKVFELKHREAAELIPLVRPLLTGGAVVTGTGYTLIVRDTPKNLEAIARVLERLDVPQRALVISVRQGEMARRKDRGLAVEPGKGETARFEDSRVRIYSTEDARAESATQTLRVLDGQWARIHTGRMLPVGQRTTNGRIVQESVRYVEASTGFEVQARLTAPDSVTLRIRPFLARPGPGGGGVIEVQQVSTVVTGRVGQWFEIGSQNGDDRDSGTGTVYSTVARDAQERHIEVKVDLAP